LKSRKNVLNHVAYRTNDLDATLSRLRDEGAFPLGPPRSAIAFGGKRVVFLFTTLDFIIELIEE
jgi:methylmalonyl-CoA/ethylmalonyl-CoA epimerase